MSNIVPVDPVPDYDWVVDKVMGLLKPSSQRVYASSYSKYGNWCDENSLAPLPLNIELVSRFIVAQPVTMNSRKRIMSAFRKLAWFMALDFNNPVNKAVYEYLLKMPVPEDGIGGNPRSKEALTESEIRKVMNTWGGDSAIELRNRAIVRLLLAFGGRRAEIAALQWQDIDLQKGTVRVQHGKGDKERESAILGNRAITSLKEWMTIQGFERDETGRKTPTRQYVFTPLDTGGKKVAADEPLSGDSIYLIVANTEKECGVSLHPHKFRRTMITALLEDGNSLPDVRDQAGHVNGSTTMGYAAKASAIALRKRMKVRWE